MRGWFNQGLASAAIALAAVSSATANDSSASLATGGLNFVYNGMVAMRQEDLFISKDRVRVRYLFENASQDDVESLVAFPLPNIETGEGGNYTIDSPDPVNFIDFAVMIDGQKITPNVQVTATSLGVDITALLSKYGLPPTTILTDDSRAAFYDRLRDLPEEALAELQRHGAISRAKGDANHKGDVNPQWTASITFYWMQKFPAGKTIEIVHSYRPVPRSFFTSMEELKSEEMVKKYCPDAAFLAAAKAFEKRGAPSGVELRYILTTGRNWLGPIGRFTLTFDKQDPSSVASTCFRGLSKSSATQFTATKEKFSPDDDLGFLLLNYVKSE